MVGALLFLRKQKKTRGTALCDHTFRKLMGGMGNIHSNFCLLVINTYWWTSFGRLNYTKLLHNFA